MLVQQFFIKEATNTFVGELRIRYAGLDKNRPTALVCGTGHRSSLGASLLKQQGFEDVSNVAGGMKGYNAAGYAPECPMCVAPHVPTFTGKRTA